MSAKFDELLDRHLTLSERVKAPNPDQARAAVELLVTDIDGALSAGNLVNDEARRMAILRGVWQQYLATPQGAHADSSPATVPLKAILGSLSAPQAWAIGIAIVTLLGGTFLLGRSVGKLEPQSRLSAISNERDMLRRRVDELSIDMTELEKADKSRQVVLQERQLAALIIKMRESSHASQLRRDLEQLLIQLEANQVVSRSHDQRRKGVRVDITRTGESWFVPDN